MMVHLYLITKITRNITHQISNCYTNIQVNIFQFLIHWWNDLHDTKTKNDASLCFGYLIIKFLHHSIDTLNIINVVIVSSYDFILIIWICSIWIRFQTLSNEICMNGKSPLTKMLFTFSTFSWNSPIRFSHPSLWKKTFLQILHI